MVTVPPITGPIAALVPAAVPPLRGQATADRDGRYRVYTIAHLPFDALPAYREGGPATVAVDGWSVSISYLDRAFSSPEVVAADDGHYTLGAFRDGHYVGAGTPDVRFVVTRHALDGAHYATREDAKRAQYEAGLIGRMVYECDAARFGLPLA